MREKINRIIHSVLHNVTHILIIVVAFASFGLGRLSVESDVSSNNTSIAQSTFEKPAVIPSQIESVKTKTESGLFVASVNGTKYHYPWCSGAQRIKEQNKIWFTDIAEAQERGYTPAANCKGLK